MHLDRPIRILATAALTAGVAAGAAGAFAATTASASPDPGHAVFLETDQVSGNQILSYDRSTDGSVSYAGTFATGGDGATAAGATADPLASQGGLALVDGGRDLVAVNAGSDTISVFSVRGSWLELTQTIASGGEFPVSVTSSGSTVAVLNSGGTGSVAEFHVFGDRLFPIPGEVRSLGLANTDPPNFLHGAGQVGFTPDGAHLVVTTKASSSAYEVFTVGPFGTLSAAPVVTTSATPVPFAFSFDTQGRLVGAEAATSTVSTYDVDPNGSLTLVGSVADGAAALCWITGVDGTFYGSNAGSATVSSFSVDGAGSPSLVQATAAATHPGTTDSAASPDGRFLYVESGGSGAFDAFAIGAHGSLTPVETVWNIPVASEGIAVS